VGGWVEVVTGAIWMDDGWTGWAAASQVVQAKMQKRRQQQQSRAEQSRAEQSKAEQDNREGK
jgi:hypothetical protein